MATWHEKHPATPGADFKRGVAAGVVEAEEVNKCRSSMKDYWRTVGMALEPIHRPRTSKSSPGLRAWEAELQSRHAVFVKLVEPVDVLDGYTDADKWVFRMFRGTH